jgi:Xaa-Pro aminopeptidase
MLHSLLLPNKIIESIHMFSADTYIQRRARLKKDLGSGVILLPGNDLSPMNYNDNQFHFRQDSNFLYFFGLDMPGLIAVIDVDANEEIIFGHNPTMDDVIWEGPLPSLPDLALQAGVRKTQHHHDIGAYLNTAHTKGQKVHFTVPYQAQVRESLGFWIGKSLPEILEGGSMPLIRAIIAQRSHKSAVEVAEMEKAHAITHDMYLYAMQEIRPGRYEYEIVGGFEGMAKSRNGAMAYPSIFSVNGHILHNHAHSNRMEEGQWVVADYGAENDMHYASDITRTIPVGRHFTPAQKDIYRIVLDAHLRSAEIMKPGVLYRDCHLLAWRVIAEGLHDLGILRGDPAEMAEIGVPGLFMPHGLGHMIGLDVHDMENLGENNVGYAEGQQRSTLLGLKSLRLAKALEQGFVLTVEPGIYFIPPLIDRWEAEGMFKDFINYDALKAYRNFGGVRIEDNYLITDDGSHMLGKGIPKTVEEVELAR